MVIAEARVETTRASRYLVQLCRHASQMGSHQGRLRQHGPGGADMPRARPEQVTADWSDTAGTITMTPWGRCTLTASSDALVLRVEASDAANLRRIQDLLGWNLTRFGRRDQLSVSWQHTDPVLEVDEDQPAAAGPAGRSHRRGHRRTIMLVGSGVVGVVLLVALHLGLAGGVAAVSRGLGWTAAGLIIVPILVVLGHAAIPIAIVRLRRRAGATPSERDGESGDGAA